jgi:purine-binding chemotaxis protein CheW
VSDDTSHLALVFRIAAGLCALPLAHVAETMRPLPVRPLDGTPDFVLGAAMVRGRPTPVVSAARLLGGAGAQDAPAGRRWISVLAGPRRVALEVDEVLGIRPLTAAEDAIRQPLLERAATPGVATLGRLDGELLRTLQAAQLVPAQAWPAVDGLAEAVAS